MTFRSQALEEDLEIQDGRGRISPGGSAPPPERNKGALVPNSADPGDPDCDGRLRQHRIQPGGKSGDSALSEPLSAMRSGGRSDAWQDMSIAELRKTFLDDADDSANGPTRPQRNTQIPLISWAAAPISSRRGYPCLSSRRSTGQTPSVKTHWPKCVGLMAFVAHAAKAPPMDSFRDAGSGGICVGKASTKEQ